MENLNSNKLEKAEASFEILKAEQPNMLEALYYLEDLKLFDPEATFLVKEMALERYQTSRYLLDSPYYKTVSRLLPKSVLEQIKSKPDEVR
jgi:hypothetical protein